MLETLLGGEPFHVPRTTKHHFCRETPTTAAAFAVNSLTGTTSRTRVTCGPRHLRDADAPLRIQGRQRGVGLRGWRGRGGWKTKRGTCLDERMGLKWSLVTFLGANMCK